MSDPATSAAYCEPHEAFTAYSLAKVEVYDQAYLISHIKGAQLDERLSVWAKACVHMSARARPIPGPAQGTKVCGN